MADDSQGDKTEAPTQHRLEEARRRGQIAFSRDFSGSIVFLAVVGVLVAGSPSWVAGLTAHLRSALGAATANAAASGALARGVDAWTKAVCVPLAVAVLAAVVSGGLQTRGLISAEAAKLDVQRALPSLRRVFSVKSLVEVGKGTAKVFVILGVVWMTVKPMLRPLTGLAGVRGALALRAAGTMVETLGLRLALAALVLGGLDLLWQRHQHVRSLRMTRDEIKREHKESEGDPKHKAERHRLHKELAEQRMVADVRRADFVVVNPDHIAVAVKYDRERDAAPVVVAKGERLLAEKIKQVAREAGVPIFRDLTLARSLRDVTEGDEIPEALYEAVAEILRVVQGSAVLEPAAQAPSEEPAPTRSNWRRA